MSQKVSLGLFRAFDGPPALVSDSHSLIMVLPTVPMPVWIRLVLLFRHACGACFIQGFHENMMRVAHHVFEETLENSAIFFINET